MYSTTITLRPNGSMTLPKKLRGKHQTIHYIAMEVPEGVLLKPIDEIEYYEENGGSFGVRFPNGIEMKRLLSMIKEANADLDREEAAQKKAGQKKIRQKNAHHE